MTMLELACSEDGCGALMRISNTTPEGVIAWAQLWDQHVHRPYRGPKVAPLPGPLLDLPPARKKRSRPPGRRNRPQQERKE